MLKNIYLLLISYHCTIVYLSYWAQNLKTEIHEVASLRLISISFLAVARCAKGTGQLLISYEKF